MGRTVCGIRCTPGRLGARGRDAAYGEDLSTDLENIGHERVAWDLWLGPLFERTDRGDVASASDEQIMILRLPRTSVELDLRASISVEWREGEVW